jgi:CBS domain containing-hemolysin-like protein
MKENRSYNEKKVGNKFIESPSSVIIVTDEKTGNIIGMVILHDLLRAQASILE